MGDANHKLDTDTHVFFYEQDFYVLSNFSAFRVEWCGISFDTAEHLYQWLKFSSGEPSNAQVAGEIKNAPSAHEAFKIAERNRAGRRADWHKVRVGLMREVLRAKADQHEYVRRKLLATDDRVLVEDSWRDDFWGWGPNRDGQNMLGRLWVVIRIELKGLVHRPMRVCAPGGQAGGAQPYLAPDELQRLANAVLTDEPRLDALIRKINAAGFAVVPQGGKP